jgi:hypothetical protein
MGNLEHILPRLYAEAQASSSSSSSSFSSNKAPSAGPAGDSQGGKLDDGYDVRQSDQPSTAGHDRDGVKQTAAPDEL